MVRPRPSLLALALLVALLVPAPAPAADAAAARPNVVVIYVDDLRFDGAACLGSAFLATPAIDALAREGVVFERSYVTTSLCCPGRASVLTGKYASTTGVFDNQPREDFQARHATMADLLGRAGYDTAFVGKWHLPNPGAAPRPGFAHWVSFDGQGQYFDQPLNVDGEAVIGEGHSADVLARYAVEFIERERGERPFWLFLSLKNCHLPFLPPARHRGLLDDAPLALPESFADGAARLPREYAGDLVSRRNLGAHTHPELYLDQLRRYWELVLGVDEVVGAVRAALERQGLTRDTLVIFTSDNGYLVGEHGLTQKGVAFEPSIRVPLVVSWPGHLEGGGRSRRLALNVDLAPTVLAAAGVEVPADLEGTSLLAPPPADEGREEFLYLPPWFLADDTPSHLVLAGGRWKYLRFRAGAIEEVLYDLERDPDERHDLAADPAAAAELEGARTRLRAQMRRLHLPEAWWEPGPAH
ncbi:MAG: sulfatase-like hydrolase/transferase [Planctomycetes bacterium]|nr:sulfatase-like hydrolase/transferase [Planctomycetota bacterium]